MPSNLFPLGALPARFRRPRVLIVGCGDVGLRAATALGAARRRGPRLLALTSSPPRVPLLRERGIQPLAGDLDAPATLRRLSGLATHVLHLAPPAADAAVWWRDFRTVALLRALSTRTPPRALVYGSTTGVYGDCGGAWVRETRAVAPATPRAVRRVDAERAVRHFGRTSGARAGILRIPGIYASDREGGTPRARLARGTPVLAAEDDVYTNHIHADDLARACVAALWRGRPQRVVNVCDHTALRLGDYMDFTADLYGLPRPPRIARAEAERALPTTLLSFMGESRRLDNARLARELRVPLLYPTVAEGLRAGMQG
ncbi:NAD-dependent epimerase/dehydratase family protein [Xylophilus sp.]|uniref:NAD-dependent epimerase/dehydratase family protein n=1 Tax=Xylophilus sp. TaxID=2653893 RepID=UPI002D807361|nr:NAD-dependent epimerase/dehydratase family protein [Xylophilus sp.]